MDEKVFHLTDESQKHSQAKSEDKSVSVDAAPVPSIDDHLNTLRSTNWDILNYFRTTYITRSEQIQTLKSELFELNVKIEELEKTKDIYSFHSDSRRSVFSPLPVQNNLQGKGQIIQNQLDELHEVQTALMKRIQTLDEELSIIRNHIKALEASNQCLATLSQQLPQPEETNTNEEDIETSTCADELEEDSITHASRILMFQQYDNSQIAERIRTSLRQPIENNQNKLEVLKWLLQSDPNRARLTLQELQASNQRLLHTMDSLLQDTDKNLSVQRPLWLSIDDCIQHYRMLHPECTIDASIDCTDYDMKVLPIITITLLQLIQEIFDNIFYHSNANRVLAKVYISRRMIDVYINDNGVGIGTDYLKDSPWYSGLHRLHEILYLLGGKLQIDGDIISGTNVRFSFPMCLENSNNETITGKS